MTKLNPYLNFDGNAEEAFNFYKSVFGGEFDSVMRFGDMPAGEDPMPEAENNKIMHISLPMGDGGFLMGSDVPSNYGRGLVVGNNTYINITPENKDEGQRIFDTLSADGKIEMAFEKAFWGDYFGAFTDKYGVQWMINCKSD